MNHDSSRRNNFTFFKILILERYQSVGIWGSIPAVRAAQESITGYARAQWRSERAEGNSRLVFQYTHPQLSAQIQNGTKTLLHLNELMLSSCAQEYLMTEPYQVVTCTYCCNPLDKSAHLSTFWMLKAFRKLRPDFLFLPLFPPLLKPVTFQLKCFKFSSPLSQPFPELVRLRKKEKKEVKHFLHQHFIVTKRVSLGALLVSLRLTEETQAPSTRKIWFCCFAKLQPRPTGLRCQPCRKGF